MEDILNKIYDIINREAHSELIDVRDPEIKDVITKYAKMYNEALEEYSNTPNPSEEIEKKLKDLTAPLNTLKEMFPYFEMEAILPPVAESIRFETHTYKPVLEKENEETDKEMIPNEPVEEKLVLENREEKTMTNEKEYVRVRKLDKASNVMNKVNGFAMAIFVLIISSVIGFILGILLFNLKK